MAEGLDEVQLAALRLALEEDVEVLRRRRTELMKLRTALSGSGNSALQDREIYLVGSIKRIEEQISVVRRSVAAAEAGPGRDRQAG